MDNRENCLLPIRCEHLKYTGEHTVHYRNKVMKPYTYYCIAEKRVRTVGTRFNWVGECPEFCPKRPKIMEGGGDSGSENDIESVRNGRADTGDENHHTEA